ncbi:MAG: peptidoglycan bridge formation glycyltransferase FemA/FemB family protein, partial [Candidatus Doudnabacteria bacterium]
GVGSKFWRSESTSLLRLSAGWDSRVKKKVRNSLNFATRKGISVRNLDLEELDSFYKIYEQTADRVGSSYRTPMSFFRSLFTFTGVSVVGAYIGTDLIAASIFLTFNNRSYYWWSASSELGLKSSANYLVLHTAIKDLEKQGITALDMASSNNIGIRDFKEQWGTETVLFSCYER